MHILLGFQHNTSDDLSQNLVSIIEVHCTIALSPGHSHVFNVMCVTLKMWEWPGDEARSTKLLEEHYNNIFFKISDHSDHVL